MALSPAFARVLAANRSGFNRRAAEARHRYGKFDTAAFGRFLQDAVDPLIVAISANAPARVEAVAAVAYDLAIELVGQRLAGPGAKSAAVDRAWRELAPRYWRAIAEEPRPALGALTNAAFNVERCTDPSSWIATLARVAPQVENLDQLRRVGQVAAWRCGLAHLREGALQVADELPEDLALAVIGETASPWSEVRTRLRQDRWWSPVAAADRTVEVGAFTGFGGTLPAPPEIRSLGDHVVIRSADRYAWLVADAFGAALQPATAAEFAQGRVDLAGVQRQGARLDLDGRSVELDLPAEGLQVTCTPHSVAVASAFSFAIRVLPRR